MTINAVTALDGNVNVTWTGSMLYDDACFGTGYGFTPEPGACISSFTFFLAQSVNSTDFPAEEPAFMGLGAFVAGNPPPIATAMVNANYTSS